MTTIYSILLLLLKSKIENRTFFPFSFSRNVRYSLYFILHIGGDLNPFFALEAKLVFGEGDALGGSAWPWAC